MHRRAAHGFRAALSSRLAVSCTAIALAALSLYAPSSQAAERNRVTSFDHRHSSTHTRLVFEMDAKPHYEHKQYEDEKGRPTFTLRLDNAKLSTRVPRRLKGSQRIKGLERHSARQLDGTDAVQLTFRLTPQTAVTVSQLPPFGAHKYRLLLDFSLAEAPSDQAQREPDASTELYQTVVLDALAKIAKFLGWSVKLLARYNNIGDENSLQVGDIPPLP